MGGCSCSYIQELEMFGILSNYFWVLSRDVCKHSQIFGWSARYKQNKTFLNVFLFQHNIEIYINHRIKCATKFTQRGGSDLRKNHLGGGLVPQTW